MTAVPTSPDALSTCPIPRPRRWEWWVGVSRRSNSTSSNSTSSHGLESRLSCERPHGLVDAVEDALARQYLMEPEAFEGVLRPQRFEPGDRDHDARPCAG